MTSVDLSQRPRRLSLTHRATELPLAYNARPGTGPSVVYLHGLGSTKQDFAAAWAELDGFSLYAFDFPGCGDTPYPEGARLTIEDLVAITHKFLTAEKLTAVTLIGHSFGGLVALLLARRYPELVSRLISIEGNVAPEDCGVVSRAAVAHAANLSASEVVRTVQQELRDSGRVGFDTYAQRLPKTVWPRAFVDYCRSIVEWSDNAPLVDYFVTLPQDRLFIYGAATPRPSYLPRLEAGHVSVAEIPNSDHFPIDSNPAAFWHQIRSFLNGDA